MEPSYQSKPLSITYVKNDLLVDIKNSNYLCQKLIQLVVTKTIMLNINQIGSLMGYHIFARSILKKKCIENLYKNQNICIIDLLKTRSKYQLPNELWDHLKMFV